MKSYAALASISCLLFASTAWADEAPEGADEAAPSEAAPSEVAPSEVAPNAEVAPGAEVAPASDARAVPPGALVASIAPAPRPDPREDSSPEMFTPALAPAPTAGATSPAATDRPASENDPHRGELGAFRLGALASAGFPSAIAGQIVFKAADWVGATASYGATPALPIPVADDARISQRGFSATARVYPFRGAFFLGLGGGQSTMTGEIAQSGSGVRAQSSVRTRTAYVMPELGFLHRFAFGLAIGADVGLQVPVSSSSETTASANGSAVAAPAELRDAMRSLGSTPIPVLNFLRLGYVL